jgi:hypothetical protein
MDEYALICPDFKFFWPNGVPDTAKRCCNECINLDETSQETIRANKCLIKERERKKKAYYEGHTKGQQYLIVLTHSTDSAQTREKVN